MRARSEATCDVHSGLLSMLGSKTTLAMVRELSWGILGRGEGGLKGIRVSGSGYNEVLALRMLNVVAHTLYVGYSDVRSGVRTRHLESPEEIQMYCSDSIHIYRAVYEVHMYVYMLDYR